MRTADDCNDVGRCGPVAIAGNQDVLDQHQLRQHLSICLQEVMALVRQPVFLAHRNAVLTR